MPQPSTILSQLFEDALHANRAEEQREWAKTHPDGKIAAHISDADKCARQVVYSIQGVPETNPPGTDSLMNFALGKAAEEAFASQLERHGVKLVREVRVVIPWGAAKITGRADFLLFIPDLNVIVELKSTTTRQLSMILKEGGRTEHRKQLMLYLLAGKMGLLEPWGITPEMCESGVLVYFVKDATRNRPNRFFLDVEFDWDEINTTMNELERLTLSAGTVPPRPSGFAYDKFPCAWCSYQDGCWKGWWGK